MQNRISKITKSEKDSSNFKVNFKITLSMSANKASWDFDGHYLEPINHGGVLWFGYKVSPQKTHVLKAWSPVHCSEVGLLVSDWIS
jgi:hypothetical protein